MSDSRDLFSIWETCHNKPGWLSKLFLSGKFTPEEIESLEVLDDNFFQNSKDTKKISLTDEELLKTFPEGKTIIYGKIKELEAEKKELEKIIEIKNYVSTLFADGFEKQYWPLVVEAIEGKKLKKIKNNLFRLYRQRNIFEGRKEKREPLDIGGAKLYPIQNYLTSFRRVGNKLISKCPLHDDKSPSFYVYENNTFHCFGCGKNGDVLDLAMALEGYNFPDAVKTLSRGQIG